uniref:Uncharacterized protein n=1 Tax=Amphora coffeiformis TaxID=265554 RepID=A0A7S3P9C3_9STRA|mmetsp:Transcript_2000/g.4376  ORF Transcript_2000/g.4376 Transcript_2000/m.4376 type:complete len:168 (+) Transcript_2000:181-684(+)
MDFKLPLLGLCAFNFCLYGTRALLGGHIINGIIEGDNEPIRQSAVTFLFLQTTLLTCMFGIAATLFGFVHVKEWTDTSRMVAMGLGLIACMMEFLTTGYGGKQWELTGDLLEDRLHFMGVSAPVEAFTMLLFVGVLFMPLAKPAERDEEGGMTDEHHDDEVLPPKTA